MSFITSSLTANNGLTALVETVEFRKQQTARHSFKLSTRLVGNSVAIGMSDTLALCAALAIGGSIRESWFGTAAMPSSTWLLVIAWWFAAAFAGLLPGWGVSAVDHLKRLVILITALFGVGAQLLFLTKSTDGVSRLAMGLSFLLAVVLVPVCRTLTRHFLCARQKYGIPTVIFGESSAVADAITRLRFDRGVGYIPMGVCTNNDVSEILGIPVRGNLDQQVPFAPAAMIATQGLDELAVRNLISTVMVGYRNVMILPNLGDVPSLLAVPRDLGGLLGLEISQTLMSPLATKVKRLVDLALVIAAMPLWLPVCIVTSILTWLQDGGPPIYKQKRAGKGEKSFFAYKCRTMIVNAEEVLQRHLAADPALRAEWDANCKLKNDPRITKVGAFLRRTSLDELPQLINVLKGDMSLIGPRPLPMYHLEKMSNTVRDVRARMRPGVTGLWQVSGRSDIGPDGMTRWDPYYVRNWSMWLDVVIFVRTIRAVVLGSGAH